LILIVQTLVYLAAIAGVVAGSFGLLYFAGGAMNQARPREMRIRRGVYAALCLCGIVASAAGGFAGLAAIMYFAQQ